MTDNTNKSVKKAQKKAKKAQKKRYKAITTAKKEAGSKRVGKSDTRAVEGTTRRPSEGSKGGGKISKTKEVTTKKVVRSSKGGGFTGSSTRSSQRISEPKTIKVKQTVKTGKYTSSPFKKKAY